MKRVPIIGDVHGNRMRACDYPDGAIQVGDFNIVSYEGWEPSLDRRVAFIDGNHDHFPSLHPHTTAPYEIQPGLYHIPRGWVSGNVLFIGGAESIDGSTRSAGYDIFPEESITMADQFRAIENGQAVDRIDTIISHTCPSFVARLLVEEKAHERPKASEIALEELWSIFRPARWIFGHFHKEFDEMIQGTQFICVPSETTRWFDLPLSSWPDGLRARC